MLANQRRTTMQSGRPRVPALLNWDQRSVEYNYLFFLIPEGSSSGIP